MSATIVLVRHGETDWNRERRFQGHADTPLNSKGRLQAQAVAALLGDGPFSAIYTSPLRRASETADIVGRHLGLDVRPVEALREIDVGSWSGLTRTEVEARHPEGYRRWLEYAHDGWESGESYDALGNRVVDAIRRIAAEHPNERVLVVTHGGPIRSAMAASKGLPFGETRWSSDHVGNCAIVRFAVRDRNLERVD